MHLRFFIVFLLTGIVAHAQTCAYHAFPDSSGTWREFDNRLNGAYTQEYNFEQFINGDTVLKGQTYHKIYKTGTYDERSWSNGQVHFSSSFINQYVAGIRQDKNAKRIYIYAPNSNEEEVLYDFNLSIGDTVPFSYIHRAVDDTIWVSGIDSIYDGTSYRRRYILDDVIGYHGGNPALIEGIGSTFGLIYSIDHPFENDGHLLCYTSANGIQFTDSSANACDLPTRVASIEQDFKIVFYPNPAKDQISIHLSPFHPDQITSVSIMNLVGKEEINSLLLPSSREKEFTTLDIGNLAAGIYFIQVVNNTGKWVGKLVKE